MSGSSAIESSECNLVYYGWKLNECGGMRFLWCGDSTEVCGHLGSCGWCCCTTKYCFDIADSCDSAVCERRESLDCLGNFRDCLTTHQFSSFLVRYRISSCTTKSIRRGWFFRHNWFLFMCKRDFVKKFCKEVTHSSTDPELRRNWTESQNHKTKMGATNVETRRKRWTSSTRRLDCSKVVPIIQRLENPGRLSGGHRRATSGRIQHRNMWLISISSTLSNHLLCAHTL